MLTQKRLDELRAVTQRNLPLTAGEGAELIADIDRILEAYTRKCEEKIELDTKLFENVALLREMQQRLVDHGDDYAVQKLGEAISNYDNENEDK